MDGGKTVAHLHLIFPSSEVYGFLMKWQQGRRSSNVDDRRKSGQGGKRVSLGIGGIVIVGVLALVLGLNPLEMISQFTSSPQNTQTSSELNPRHEVWAEMCSVVLADTEDTWKALFAERGQTYREPRLVLYTGTVQTAAGMAEASTGPFYLPADETIYIDLSFFDELAGRFNAPGDFAQAYVLAHEVGHHVQNLLGILEQGHRIMAENPGKEANRISVLMELQADYLAGVWAHYAQKSANLQLDEGDIREGLSAAAAVGDDRLQEQARGYAVPDSFTHGSSEQRTQAFMAGFQSGDFSEVFQQN